MNDTFGLAELWAQGDTIAHVTALVLVAMSVASWYIIVSKAAGLLRLRRSMVAATQSFWIADTRDEALAAIGRNDRSGVFADVAADAVEAARAYEERRAGGIGAGVDASDFVGRTLQQSTVFAQARVERGLTVLASVGATAPFVGLFGTVWGIYNALIGLSGAKQVVLDQVAGPVGEALIMTAAGLFVAIPAVLAYNAFTRANRLVLAQLDGFANSLHAYLVAGVRIGPQDGGKVTPLPTARAA
ncbi:MAG TPA: MotA/TolQ/ExbB proton channel family protein [Rhodocyclaceae bacterium]|nr:MotA/TolQ/ExbB proton channel family protein [Rhodocyclaceae bacterium]HRQ46696.1 MotA/TolQ/ExbB proton channel family protein [Rhodocyclaceae bacterium]